MARRLFLLLLILTWLASNLVLGAEWRFYPLGDLGGDEGFGRTSQAWAVSGNARYVVGDSLASAGLGITTGVEALLWSSADAPLTRLGTLAGQSSSSAKAVSLSGTVVGEIATAEGKRAFRWTEQAGLVPLGVLPGHEESVAYDISHDGQVVVGKSGSFAEELAVQWRNGQILQLGDLPGGDQESVALSVSADGSVIVGHSSSERGTEAFIWSQGTLKGLGSLAGDRFVSHAFAVSADGQTVVGDARSASGPEAFRWTAKTGMEPLGDLPEGGFQSRAMGVSADGGVVVGKATGANGYEAFLWTPDSKLQSLGQLLAQQQLADGWRLREACGISDDGRVIVGWGQNPADETTGWIVVRPPAGN